MKRSSALGALASAPFAVAGLASPSRAQGGTVRVGSVSQPNTLNPLFASLLIESHIYTAVFSGLLSLDERSRLIPDLALAVPTTSNGGISADGKTITYALRTDAKWHDGVAVTAADVAFTFARYLDDAVTFPSRSTYEQIESVEAAGPHTVVIKLKAPNPDATVSFFVSGQNGSIIPKHVLEGTTDWHRSPFNGMPIGSGPYRVAHWDRGNELVMTANPAYFRGAPSIETIAIKFVPDGNTLTIGMKSGATDLSYDSPPATLPMLSGASNVSVKPIAQDAIHWLLFNTTAEPTNDARVRRALAIAVDRPQIVNTVFRGFARPALDIVPPWSPYTTPDAAFEKPNASAAAALLESAGWKAGQGGKRSKGGTTLTLDITTVAGSPTRQGMALILQSLWKALGIDVGVKSLPLNTLFSPDGVFARGAFEAGLAGFSFLPSANRSNNIASESVPPHGFNYSRYRNADVDRWIVQTRSTPNGPARAKQFHQIGTAIARDCPLVPVAWFVDPYIISNELHGVRPGPDAGLFWNVWEWTLSR